MPVFFLFCYTEVKHGMLEDVDRIENEVVLKLSGQPNLNEILRRNRLRWFWHVNRMHNARGEPMLTKKVLFAYFENVKRPQYGVKKRWKDKIKMHLHEEGIFNSWRR